MDKLLFLVSLLSFQSAFSADATEQLIQKFQSRMSVLDREMVTFRYEARTKTGFKTPDDIRVRVSDWTNRFYDPAITTSDLAGPGTYVAIDPYGSRSYGGTNPQLYVMTLKKGTRVLNLDESLKKEEKALIKELHQQLQCRQTNDANQLIEEEDMNYFSLRQSSTIPCREAAIKIATALKTQAIMYGYSASNSLVGCRERHVAINVTSAQSFDYSKTLFYSNETAIVGVDYGRFIKKIYDESDNDFDIVMSAGDAFPMPAELEKQSSVSDKDYLPWRNSKIYTCGPKWASEGKSAMWAELLKRNFQLNYRDAETQSTLLALKKAFTAKAKGTGYFNPNEILKIMLLSFKGTGLPQDEATFNRWVFLTKNKDQKPEYKEELKKLFGIKQTVDELGHIENDVEKYFKSLSKKQLRSPELYLNAMAYFGITGGYAVYIQNEGSVYMGGAVVISSIDPHKSFAENLAISTRSYKEAIKECLAMYTDANLSYDEIQKTDCAIKND